MSLKLFFEEIFLKKDTIKDILNLYPTLSEKGFKFERCADLLIKLGFLPIFSNDLYKHVIGNISDCKISFLTDFKKYIDLRIGAFININCRNLLEEIKHIHFTNGAILKSILTIIFATFH